MIDLNDIKRIYRENGTVKQTWYKVYCDSCNKDRGYCAKNVNTKHPNCLQCSRIGLFTQEVKEKMSKSRLGVKPSNLGQVGVSEETRRKMSEAKIGKSPSNKGKTTSEETKIKISNKLTGKTVFEGFKAKCMAIDINCRIKSSLRARLYSAVKNDHKKGSAVRDLGCSIEEFKKYFETLFEEGMSWSNWGKNTWHIDHIIPMSSVDMSNLEELKKICNYKNLRPIWADVNSEKCNIQIPERDLSSKKIYIVTGPSGSGKTELCSNMNISNKSYDKLRYGLLDAEYPDVCLIDTSVRATFLANSFKQMGAEVKMVYLKISKEQILKNIHKRRGVYKSVDARIKRYASLEKMGRFDFIGDFDECKNYIEEELKVLSKSKP